MLRVLMRSAIARHKKPWCGNSTPWLVTFAKLWPNWTLKSKHPAIWVQRWTVRSVRQRLLLLSKGSACNNRARLEWEWRNATSFFDIFLQHTSSKCFASRKLFLLWPVAVMRQEGSLSISKHPLLQKKMLHLFCFGPFWPTFWPLPRAFEHLCSGDGRLKWMRTVEWLPRMKMDISYLVNVDTRWPNFCF